MGGSAYMFPISGSSLVPYMKQLNQQGELFNMLITTYVIRRVKGSLDQHQQFMHKQDIMPFIHVPFSSTQNICRCYVHIRTT